MDMSNIVKFSFEDYPVRVLKTRESPVPPSQRMLNVMAETGELASTLRAGLADGVLDDDEKTAIVREIEHLRAQLDGLERDIRRA